MKNIVMPDTDVYWDSNLVFLVQFKPDEKNKVLDFIEQCAGYAAAATIRGEGPEFSEWPVSEFATLFKISLDLTKSARDDIGDCMSEFPDDFEQCLLLGSPVRKTNRSGAGTKDTRLINPIPEFFSVRFFASDMSNDFLIDFIG